MREKSSRNAQAGAHLFLQNDYNLCVFNIVEWAFTCLLRVPGSFPGAVLRHGKQAFPPIMRARIFARTMLIVLGCTVALCAATVPVQFVGSISGLGGPANNVYYYPYQLIVNGNTMTVACDVFDNSVHLNETWNASVNTFADLSNTFYGSGATTQYEEAAWLYTQFLPTPPLSDNVNAAINWAIWDIMDPDTGGFNTGTPSSNTSSVYWINKANLASANSFYGLDFSDFVIYTPVNGWPSNDGMPQEYIGEVPEPATVMLLLSGLLGLCFVAWKRKALLN